MLLKQLKQFTLSAVRRNAGLTRFYGSPAVCESLTTSKVPKRLSRDDRRALVESFVNEYRAANAGKFPSLHATHKEVGGSYYMVRDIFQELKLNPKAPVPIVDKALSEVSASLPNALSEVSVSVSASLPNDLSEVSVSVSASLPNDLSEVSVSVSASLPNDLAEVSVSASLPNDLSEVFVSASLPNDLSEVSVSASLPNALSEVSVSASLPNALSEVSVSASLPNDASSQTVNEPQSQSSTCNAEHFSPVVVDPDFQSGSPGTIETGIDQRQATIDSSDPPTHDKRETEIAPANEFDSSNTHLPESQNRIVLEERLENTETEEEANLHLGSQESKADHLEEAAVSANVVPTETRQVSETGAGEVKTEERSSAWSSITSFAKEFAKFWRKG